MQKPQENIAEAAIQNVQEWFDHNQETENIELDLLMPNKAQIGTVKAVVVSHKVSEATFGDHYTAPTNAEFECEIFDIEVDILDQNNGETLHHLTKSVNNLLKQKI